MDVLGKMDRAEREEGGRCLGRRMECFESVEAEGRQFAGNVMGREGGEGEEVPMRVLFDVWGMGEARMGMWRGVRGRVKGEVGGKVEGGLEEKVAGMLGVKDVELEMESEMIKEAEDEKVG